MKIDDLIAILQRARKQVGNVDVSASSFCGTNDGHVLFELLPTNRKNFCVSRLMNGYGQLCLSIKLSDKSRECIKNGVGDMKAQGYQYFRSQYVRHGQAPQEGLSPCEWHGVW